MAGAVLCVALDAVSGERACSVREHRGRHGSLSCADETPAPWDAGARCAGCSSKPGADQAEGKVRPLFALLLRRWRPAV